MVHSGDLTQGSIPKHMIALAFPLIMGNILQQLYNTADAFMLGRFAGEAEFAAVGVGGAVMNLFLFIIAGACTGLSVLFARFYGADDLRSFRSEHFVSLSFGFAIALITALLGLAILPLILKAIKTPVDIYSSVYSYLRIILLALPFAFLYNLYSALLRSIGKADAALAALFSAVALNLLLDYLFIAKLGLGIEGAAFATGLSECISSLFCILYLIASHKELLIKRSDCYINRKLLRDSARLSSVTALHQSSLYIGKLLVQGAVNVGGTDLIAAYTATTRIEGFANSFADSGSSATSVVVSQNVGAEKKDRVEATFRWSLILMTIMGLTMSLIMVVSAKSAVSFMLGSGSGASFDNAVRYMRLIAFFYLFCFLGNTFAGYFNGRGRVIIPFIGATGHITLRVILSWIFVRSFGLSAVAVATGIGWMLVNAFWGVIKIKERRK